MTPAQAIARARAISERALAQSEATLRQRGATSEELHAALAPIRGEHEQAIQSLKDWIRRMAISTLRGEAKYRRNEPPETGGAVAFAARCVPNPKVEGHPKGVRAIEAGVPVAFAPRGPPAMLTTIDGGAGVPPVCPSAGEGV